MCVGLLALWRRLPKVFKEAGRGGQACGGPAQPNFDVAVATVGFAGLAQSESQRYSCEGQKGFFV